MPNLGHKPSEPSQEEVACPLLHRQPKALRHIAAGVGWGWRATQYHNRTVLMLWRPGWLYGDDAGFRREAGSLVSVSDSLWWWWWCGGINDV